ncbi:MAG: TIGR00266 family protein [Deltaproteobacteria bacterium]|nr:TIGR00266 family protein [Deltaproteobacteria bacterium]
MAEHWYYEGPSGQEGPVSQEQIEALLGDGTIPWTARVWNESMSDWAPASEVLTMSTGPEDLSPPDAHEASDAGLDSPSDDGPTGTPTGQELAVAGGPMATKTGFDAPLTRVDGGLEHAITHRPDFAMLRVQLAQGEKVLAEPSAMATMDPSIELQAGLKGGLLKSIGRAFGGESMIVNTFTAKDGDGEVVFAPGPMGDMQHVRLRGDRVLLQRGAYVASSEGIEIDGKWEGFRGFFSGEGMVLLQARGEGDLWFNTYGAMLEIDVRDGYYVDTGYIVAFEDTLQYEVTVLPGLSIGSKIKSFLFGGEGLVCRFSGEGKLWVQTRTVNPFLQWVYPYRPQQQNN